MGSIVSSIIGAVGGPILAVATKMALRMLTARALEDLVLWAVDRLADDAKSPATKDLVKIVKENLSRNE